MKVTKGAINIGWQWLYKCEEKSIVLLVASLSLEDQYNQILSSSWIFFVFPNYFQEEVEVEDVKGNLWAFVLKQSSQEDNLEENSSWYV